MTRVVQVVQCYRAALRDGRSDVERRRVMLGRLAETFEADGYLWAHVEPGRGRGHESAMLSDLPAFTQSACPLSPVQLVDGMLLEAGHGAVPHDAQDQSDHCPIVAAGVRSRLVRWLHGSVPNLACSDIVGGLVDDQDSGRSAVLLLREKDEFPDRDLPLLSMVLRTANWLRRLPATNLPSADASLPPRQREVLELLVAGRSRQQIARQLGISHYTVGDHVKEIHRRLGVRSRGQLLAMLLHGRLTCISQGRDGANGSDNDCLHR